VTTIGVLQRALGRVRPVRGRFLAKLAFVLVGLVPVLLLPWPIKILIDHVIVGVPLDRPDRPYPFFVAWLTERLPADDPMGILWGTVVVEGLLLLLVGAFGIAAPEQSRTDTAIAQGEDIATTSENAANSGWSGYGGILGLVETWFTMRLTQDLNHRFRRDAFARLLHAPMPSLTGAVLGDAVFRVMYDTPAITNACYRVLLTPVVAPVGLCLAIGALQLTFPDVPELVHAALLFLPVSFFVTWPFATALRRAATASRDAGARTTARITDSLSRVAAVQGLGTADTERQHFGGASAAGFATHRRMILIGLAAVIVAILAGIVLGTRTFLRIVDLVIAGRLSVGDFALLFSYYGLVVFFVVELGTSWIRLQTAAAGLERVFALLDAPVDAAPPHPLAPPARPTRIRFEDVGVTHPDGTEALDGVSCELRRGELAVVVGPAGAGKTTLASLVPAFVSPTRGRVLIDGLDVARMDPETLRTRVAFAFQEPALLEGTIADNVRLGRPDATDAELAHAAARADVDAIVRGLPAGFATPVGRRGMKLSVGQRQRVGLARAFLRDAPIVILDEPSAALDAASERRLVDALRDLRTDRILLVISHRLAMARAADRVLVLDRGRLLEVGTPDELAARDGGAYRRYVMPEPLTTRR
jgi:ABC-type multidrug transport system fused ATPase/permease subunit